MVLPDTGLTGDAAAAVDMTPLLALQVRPRAHTAGTQLRTSMLCLPALARMVPLVVSSCWSLPHSRRAHVPSFSLQAEFAVFSSSNVAAAYAFAARAHAGQFRKNGQPVLTHLVATARILAELGLPEEVVAAGLLHDVLCDTPVTAAQLSAVLPTSVVSLVSRVSQLNQLSQNYRDNTHSLEAEAMLDMLTGRHAALGICTLLGHSWHCSLLFD